MTTWITCSKAWVYNAGPCYTKRFKKDLQRVIKSGKNTQKLKTVIKLLVAQKRLPAKYKEHKLIGEFKERLECHIEPDWLLIYKIVEDSIIFEMTGSHSDLFK